MEAMAKEGAMKKLALGLALTVLIFWVAGIGYAEPKIAGKTVEYSAQGVVMKGYLA
jgi:hypothetical protein